jgi:hypothetical protein
VPTRKQRRRQAKERRHDYEYVYVDDEGNEVEDAPADREGPAKEKPKAVGTGVRPSAKQPAQRGGQPARGGQSDRGVRKVDPPSWQKVFRRAAIFAPVMLLVVYFLRPSGATPASLIVQVAALLLFFLPFSYFMDSLMYRNYRKKIGDPIPPRERKPKAP